VLGGRLSAGVGFARGCSGAVSSPELELQLHSTLPVRIFGVPTGGSVLGMRRSIAEHGLFCFFPATYREPMSNAMHIRTHIHTPTHTQTHTHTHTHTHTYTHIHTHTRTHTHTDAHTHAHTHTHAHKHSHTHAPVVELPAKGFTQARSLHTSNSARLYDRVSCCFLVFNPGRYCVYRRMCMGASDSSYKHSPTYSCTHK
jgi:hypothetical protein